MYSYLLNKSRFHHFLGNLKLLFLYLSNIYFIFNILIIKFFCADV